MSDRLPIARFCQLAPGATLILLLSACAAPKPETPASPVALPGGWTQPLPATAAETTSLDVWWQQFGDPVLAQLVERAWQDSPTFQSAISRLRQAQAQWGVTRSGHFPSLSAGASANGSRSRNHETETNTNSESYGASLSASWEPDFFGRQALERRAADADLAGAAEDLKAAQAALAAEVAQNYIALRLAEVQLQVARRNLANREETTRITQWRQTAGLIDDLDLLQAQASLEQSRASIPNLEQSITQNRNQLAVLIGATPQAVGELLASTATIPTPPATVTVGIPAEALGQRPDVRGARLALEAALARRHTAERARWPSLDLSGSLGVSGDDPNLFSPASTVARIGASLAQPIFDGGRINRNQEIAEEQATQALNTYESTLLTAYTEVENALLAIQTQAQRRGHLETATEAARQALELAQFQYEAGAVDLIVVLNAQSTLLSLEEQLATNQASQANAVIQLYRALGGGWNEATLAAALQ